MGLRIGVALGFGVWLLGISSGRAQVRTDGTLGARQTLAGPDVLIPSSLGQVRGGNLFHSFAQFDVADGGSATFSGGSSIHNVLARVTGGAASQINGRLACDIDGANVYLINPAGIVFGANGSLDVRGSFVATTADSVGLKDGGRFVANPARAGVLTSAAPAAFGFLKRTGPGPVIRFDGGALAVPDGKAISFVAGGIEISAGELTAVDGRVNLIAPPAGATVSMDPSSLDGAITMNHAAGRGPITISTGSFIDVSGDVGGRISMQGGAVFMTDGATLYSNTTGAGPGRGIDVSVDSLRMTAGGSIEADSSSAGRGGAVVVRATGAVDVDDADTGRVTGITTHALDVGLGGDLTIRAGLVRVVGQGGIISGAPAAGDAGRLAVIADSMQILRSGGISGSSFGMGAAADVMISVTNDLTLDGGGSPITGISALGGGVGSNGGHGGVIFVKARSMTIANGASIDASTFGHGAGGAINVRVGRSLVIDGGGTNQLTGILCETLSSSEAGNGGDVTVAARSLRLQNGGQISTSTDGAGNAGRLTLNVRRGLEVDGAGMSALPTGIFSQTQGTGLGGDVLVNAGSLTMVSGGLLDDSTFGLGDAGRLTVRVSGALKVDQAGIFSDNGETGAPGRGGQLTVEAGTIELTHGGQINAGTKGSGDAGELVVTADSIRLDSGGLIRARTQGTGAAGTLTINARRDLTVADGGIFSDSAAGAGRGGDVMIQGGEIVVSGAGTISAGSQAARAGTVMLNAGAVRIVDGGRVTVRSESGTAGDIVIDASREILVSDRRAGVSAATLRLDESKSTGISAQAVGGDGGNITLTTPGVLTVRNSLITARAAGAGAAITIDPPVVLLIGSVIDGQTNGGRDVRVTIDPVARVLSVDSVILSNNQSVPSPVDLAGVLTPFSLELATSELTLVEECPRRIGSGMSSFLILGRGGTPAEGGGLMPALDLSGR
ncbi:MAG: filamentous hemagglutinin family N-terminal domain protein [Phycisphaerales bacterium]|nr:filamentous hemagglutinin family N-terminal domain protein [Phycisphaerales bacterium]